MSVSSRNCTRFAFFDLDIGARGGGSGERTMGSGDLAAAGTARERLGRLELVATAGTARDSLGLADRVVEASILVELE